MAFRKGAEEAAQASKRVDFQKTNYFKVEPGKSVIFRMLQDTDEWITVDQHQYVSTKGQPPGYEGNWPTKFGAVCRKEQGFRKPDGSWEEGFDGECFICDHMTYYSTKAKKQLPYKPSARLWALAVLREEVRGDDGSLKGYRDQTREVNVTDKDGKATNEIKVEKAIVVVNMAWSNFFGNLQGYAEMNGGTVLDRDYIAKREGDDENTKYFIMPMAPIQVPDPDDKSKAITFDLRDPRFMARYTKDMPDLEQILKDRASKGLYDRYFDTRVAAPANDGGGTGGGTGGAPAEQQAKPPTDSGVDPDALAALAARVKGHGTPEGESTPGEPEPAAAGVMQDFG